jgi:hypothetical protein
MKARKLSASIMLVLIVSLVVGVVLQSERPFTHVPLMPLALIGAFIATAAGLKRMS